MTLHAQPKASHIFDGSYVEDKVGEEFNSYYPATSEPTATLHAATDAILDQFKSVYVEFGDVEAPY